MAEPNKKTKTISFAGRDIDQNEFNRRARQKANEWAQYQGLKGDELTDFNESLNDILAGISDGRYSVTETGALSGKGPGAMGAYDSRTGQRVDNAQRGNPRHRRGFDPNANVMGFLNGIAGSLSEGAAKKKSGSSSGAKAMSAGQYLSNQIFGEGNNFSVEQLVKWADAHDAVGTDGKRGIEGRRNFIVEQLGEYKKGLLNGDYDLSDDQRDKEIETIDQIIASNSADPDKDWQLSKVAPWMSHLLFRDKDYYASTEERKAAEEKSAEERNKAALDAYIRGDAGSSNPYEPGTQGYDLAEQAKQAAESKAFDTDFATHTWNYGDSGKSFRTEVSDSLPQDVFSGWNVQKIRDYLAGAEGLVTNEYGQDVDASWKGWGETFSDMGAGAAAGAGTGAALGLAGGPFAPLTSSAGAIGGGIIGGATGLITGLVNSARGSEMFHDNYTGWGEGDTSLENSGLKGYFDALTNNYRPDDTTKSVGGFNARSNKALLGKAGADYARAIIANDGENYQLADGSYLLPQFIDWNSGKAYKFNLHGNKMTITTANIGSIINGLTPGSPLYTTLLNEWRSYNKRPVLKDGGILLAANGDKLSQGEIDILKKALTPNAAQPQQTSDYKPLYEGNSLSTAQQQLADDQKRYQEAQANGVDKQKRIDEGNKTLGEAGWSGADKARLVAAGLDISSLIAATTGVGIGAGAALGVGSTLTTLGADIVDPSVSGGEVAKQLGVNLAIDAASLIPGLGAGAEGAKIAKNLIKIVPKLIPIFTTLSTGPEAINTLKKVQRDGGFRNVTKEELRNLGYCISSATGTLRLGKTEISTLKNRPPKGAKQSKYAYKDAAGNEQFLRGQKADDAVAAINEAGKEKGTEAALKALEAATGVKGAQFANGEKFESGLLGKWKTKVAKTSPDRVVDNDATLAWLNEHLAKNAKVREKYPRLSKVFGTDFELMFGDPKFIANPLASDKTLPAKKNLFWGESTGEYKLGNSNKYLKALEAKSAEGEKTILENIKLDGEKAARGLEPTIKKQTTELQKAQKTAQTEHDEFFKKELNKVKESQDKVTKAAEELKKAREAALKIFKKGTAESKQTRLEEFIKKQDDLAKLEAIAEASRTAEQTAQIQTLTSELQAATQLKKAANYKAALDKIKGYREHLSSHETANQELTKANEALAKRQKTKEGKKHVEALEAAKKAIGATKARELSDYMTESGKLGYVPAGATEAIKGGRQKNMEAFINFLKSKNLSDERIMALLADKAFMQSAREAFKFGEGGIIKANDGTALAAPVKPKPTTPPKLVDWTGTISAKPTNKPTATLTGSDTTSGPYEYDWGDYEGVINPWQRPGASGETRLGINPIDFGISRLEDAKYGLTQGLNGAIYQTYLGMKGFHETPLLKHYRQWSAKPLEDQMAKTIATYRLMGNRSAAGTTDQNQAFAYNLAATDRAMSAIQPLALQANEQIRTTVDQQNAVGNENFANMHEVGERNRQGDVALANARKKYYADYLHKLGTTAVQNMSSRQYGMAKAGIANDQRAVQAAAFTDPTVAAAKKTWIDLKRKQAMDPDNFTEEDAKALRRAQAEYSFAYTDFVDNWTANHLVTTGTPYAGYGTLYTLPPTYSPYGYFARGGKMEAAEKEKTRREYEKIFHDSMKLLVKESNKKLAAGKGAYAFYRKLFMHAK